jgi:superkiller protein 3
LYVNLGLALTKQGKLDEAIAAYKEAIRLQPDEALGYVNLGALLCDLKHDYAGAIAAFQEAIRLKPDFIGAYANLGVALAKQGKLDEALAAYKEIIRLQPDTAPAHNRLAWLLANCPDVRLRDPRQAVVHAGKAVDLAPGRGEPWGTLGVAQYRNAAWQAAVDALMKSVQLSNGGTSSDFFFLAMAHWQLGEKEKARTWYDQAVAWMDKHKPQDEELRRFRAEAADLLGISETAEEQKGKK